MRLNSSKQAQAPAAARPLKNLDMAATSSVSEQLKTTHCRASALARSCAPPRRGSAAGTSPLHGHHLLQFHLCLAARAPTSGASRHACNRLHKQSMTVKRALPGACRTGVQQHMHTARPPHLHAAMLWACTQACPRALVVSVLPVPAGPAGAPPSVRCTAPAACGSSGRSAGSPGQRRQLHRI